MYPLPYQDIYHRYSGTVKVKHSSEATHAVDAHRAYLAYSSAAEAIGALLVKYAADIEVEAASRKAFADKTEADREAKRKDLEAQIKVLEANAPVEPKQSFWAWLKPVNHEAHWVIAAKHANEVSRLHRELDRIGTSSFYHYIQAKSTEERQAQALQHKLEEKSHLAYVVDGHLTLTTAEAIEMSKAEDGTLAEEIERMFQAMVMRNGEAE